MIPSKLTPAVLLVADRTLAADYKILFDGIFATMQTTHVPEIAMRGFVAPKVKTDASGRAVTAPLGLRRVESSLIAAGLSSDDVLCTTPEALHDLLGPWVKVLIFSSSDPLGTGMSNTTTTNFWSGELYTSYWTRQMLTGIAEAKQKYGFKIVAGGAGAWQLNADRKRSAELGIDVIFDGYFEDLGPKLIDDIINARTVDQYICETKTAIANLKPITRASAMGIMELSRGCGRGCNFCTTASRKMEHLPVEIIISDIETNLAAGIDAVVSSSEDFFRYGAVGIKPDFEKLCELLSEMQKLKRLSFMQIDHGNVTSVLQLTDEQLIEIRRLLTWQKHSDYLWVNMGVESANGHLVAANCPGKIAPYQPEQWEDMVRQAVDKMSRTGFFSVLSVILGLPGETPDDVTRTLKLIKYLAGKHAVIFPIFYEPLTQQERQAGHTFTVKKMTLDHLELYRTCYEINFQKIPRLFWDNQRAGGVSWAKRSFTQLLGKTEVVAWRKTFKTLEKKLQTATINKNE